MAQVRLTLEYLPNSASSTMRWERICSKDAEGAFELICRAFEMAQREEHADFPKAIAAFLRGAMIRKEDIADALGSSES